MLYCIILTYALYEHFTFNNRPMEDGQEFIDIVETVYRGARKGQY